MQSQLIIEDQHSNGVLAFDLRDVLRAIGPDALLWRWKVSSVDSSGEALAATGPGAEKLQRLAVSGEAIAGHLLLRIADQTQQVIWGEFRAFGHEYEEVPIVRIVAFDSTFYKVWSNTPAICDRLRARFKNVR